MLEQATVDNINRLSAFLAAYEAPPPPDTPNCAFLLAGSAILHTCRALFDYLQEWQTPTVLIIAGGIGHSTPLLYDAVARHPLYSVVSSDIADLPEARVIERILCRFWPVLEQRIADGTLTLLVDDKSTNCSENGLFATRLLDQQRIRPSTIVLVQDPTMSLRTAAGLRKLYDGEVVTWPTFVPTLRPADNDLFAWSDKTLQDVQADPGDRHAGLWDQQRFIDLLLGEVPRLKLYGPEGKGYIAAVTIPHEIREADQALRRQLRGSR